MQQSDSPHDIRCLEVWGGNRVEDTTLNVPGIDAWIYSQPYQGADRGGDLHYISSCFTGRVSRFAVADVSGHGESVGELAGVLRKLMRKHINYLDQSDFAQRLNEEFEQRSNMEHFATAVLISYFAPTDHIVVRNAGHPPPLWYRAASDTWELLHHDTPHSSKAPNNLPLGIIQPTEYVQFAAKLEQDDVLLLYTDSLVEAMPENGQLLGNEGLLNLARALPRQSPRETGQALLDAVAAYRLGAPADDDQTLLVLHHNASEVPFRPVRKTIRAIGAMLGLAGD